MPDLLDALDDAQRRAVVAVRGPVCVLAGAGTGKTRTITHRIAHAVAVGAVAPEHVLAVTFTARAAGEMRARLAALGAPGVTARTFHAAALRQVTHFWPQVVGGEPPRVAPSKLPVLADAARRAGAPLQGTRLRDVAAEVEWAKARLVGVERYTAEAETARREPPVSREQVQAIYAGYEELKQSRGLVDFEDLLMVAAAFCESEPAVAAQVRDRYRHFTVDEYQDVSPLQQRLLDAWLGDRKDLCVVGDPNQTIYTFAGARASYLLEFGRRFPGAHVVELGTNYRSTPQVIAVANRLNRGGVQLSATAGDGPAPTLRRYDDDAAEAAGIAARCRALLADGVPAHEIAVLVRTNGQTAVHERALADAGVPYVVRGAERFFDRPVVRRALVVLRASVASGEEAGAVGEHVRHVLASVGWADEAPAAAGETREAWESLAAIVRLADEHDGDVASFVGDLHDRAAAQHAPPPAGVTLASLHAAKGLEWDAVFVAGLVDGYVPITYATTPEQVAEERRLLYVGVTRARRELWLTWYGARRRSRFLDEIAPPDPQAPAATSGGRRTARKAAVCRSCGGALHGAVARKLGRCEDCPSTADEALVDRLKAWRLEQARAAKLPAYCIFTDATLLAIAETRPADPAALAAIPGVGARKLELYADDVLALVDTPGVPAGP